MMQIKSVLNTVMLRMHDNTDGGARVVYLCCGGIVVARSWGCMRMDLELEAAREVV